MPLILDTTLTAAYQASRSILISAGRMTIDFSLVVTAAAATVNWYLEFATDDPNASSTKWYRETAEEDAGAGVVLVPEVVRTFADSGGSTLAVGTHNVSTQFVRQHQFARLQIKESGGSATVVATINSPFGDTPVSP